MPLSGPCWRLNTLRCNTLHVSSNQTFVSTTRSPAGRRVLVSCSSTRERHIPRLRSPIQWSHIVHHVRKPGFTAVIMGAESPTNLVQARTHAGHSHGHHHHHDNTYLTSSNKDDPGVRITRIGLYVNLGMAIGKGVGGYVFNSQA